MKRSVKKSLPLLLAAIILMSFLAGCKPSDSSSSTTSGSSKPNSSSQSGTDEKFNVELSFMLPGEEPAAQEAINKAVSEKMKADGYGDFTFKYTFVPWDQYWNKLNLARAGEENYDIMWQHATTIAASVANYLVAPLDDALNTFGKDLLAYLPEYAFKESTFHGKIFSIPRLVPSAQSDHALSIRGDLRKKYNLPELKTLADIETYLAAVKENETGMIPISGPLFRETMFREYVPSWYFPASTTTLWYPIYIDLADANFTVKNFWASDEFKTMCDKAEDWRLKGYFPADYDPKTTDKISNGKYGAQYGNVMFPTEHIDMLTQLIPTAEIETVFINPDKPKYMVNSEDNLLSVFEHSKKVDASVAFINWIHSSQENYDLYTYGVEGKNWNKVGEAASVEGITEKDVYAPISWVWTDLRYHRYSAALNPDYIDVINTWDDNAIKSDLLGFSVDMEAVKKEMSNLSTVSDTYVNPVYWGATKLDRDNLLKDAKAAGIDAFITEIQRQVDEYLGK